MTKSTSPNSLQTAKGTRPKASPICGIFHILMATEARQEEGGKPVEAIRESNESAGKGYCSENF